jgi:hypothetical protein
MQDLAFIALVFVFFAGCLGLVSVCQHLMED